MLVLALSLALPVFSFPVKRVEPKRQVPGSVDDGGRLSYLAIAKRAQIESVNLYTIMSIGSQIFVSSRALR